MITITPVTPITPITPITPVTPATPAPSGQTPLLLSASPVSIRPTGGTRRRRTAAVLRRIGEALRRRPTPSEQVLDELRDVETLRRW